MAQNSDASTTIQSIRNSGELRIIKAVRKHPKAFGELYNLYVKKVYRYLYSRVGNKLDAEDLTAQTFLAAFESFENFREDDHFAAWLFTIARNKTMDHFRKRDVSISMNNVLDVSVESDPLIPIIQSEQVAALENLLKTLPDEDQELLRLRFLAVLSFPEIARLLHRNEDAVKTTLYRLLARLHSKLEVSYE